MDYRQGLLREIDYLLKVKGLFCLTASQQANLEMLIIEYNEYDKESRREEFIG